MQGYGGVGPGGFGGRGPPMPPRPFDPSLLKRPRDDALYGGLGMGGGDEGRGWEGGDFKRLATGLGGAEGQEEESPYAVSLLVPCDAVGHLIGKVSEYLTINRLVSSRLVHRSWALIWI